MIDNTKKIKEFHETLAFEKFSNNNAYRQANNVSPGKKPTSKMENQCLEKRKEIEIKKRKNIIKIHGVMMKKMNIMNN